MNILEAIYDLCFNIIAFPGIVIARLTYRKNVPAGKEVTGHDVGLVLSIGVLVYILIFAAFFV